MEAGQQFEKVLVIDDEESVLVSLERLLRKEGCQVIKALGGEEGIQYLHAETEIAVVVCDQQMPGIPGIEVLRTCRKLHPNATRIALTGASDAELIGECLNDELVNRFLLKPWDANKVCEVVRHAVENSVFEKDKKRIFGQMKADHNRMKARNEKLEQLIADQEAQLEKAKESIELNFERFGGLLGQIAEIHVPGVHGHGRRTATIARKLAELAGLLAEEIEDVAQAALLHDIGLVAVPHQLLEIPESTLNLQERKIVCRHPYTGHELLKDIEGMDRVAKLVRSHHEALDGSGYPDGLFADMIPVTTRILTIADTFDSILFPRNHLAVTSQIEAMEEMRKLAGKRVDADLLELLINHVHEIPHTSCPDTVLLLVEQLRQQMILADDINDANGNLLYPINTRLDNDAITKLQGNRAIDAVSTRIEIMTRSLVPCGGEQVEAVSSESEERPLVFAVDDELHVLQALRRELRRSGYEIRCFSAPQDLLDELKQVTVKPFAVLCDFNMPGIKGDVLIKRIHQQVPDLPCIVISGETTRANIKRLIEVGAVHSILRKPWSKEKLLELLSALQKRVKR